MRTGLVGVLACFAWGCLGAPAAQDGGPPDAATDGGGPGAPLALDHPSGVAVTARYLLVTEVAARATPSGVSYGQGRLDLIDRRTLGRVARLDTSRPNPQWVFVDPAGRRAFVVNAGTLDTNRSPALATGPGSVDVFDLSGDGPPRGPLRSIEIAPVDGEPSAAPGRLALAPDGRHALVGSGVAPVLYKLDLEEGRLLRGPDDPIRPFSDQDKSRNGLTAPVADAPRGRLYVIDFNGDRLCASDDPTPDWAGDLGDRRCGPIGRDPSQLEGPIDLLPSASSPSHLYVLTSLGGSLLDVDVGASPFRTGPLVDLGPSAPNAIASCDGRTAYVVNSLFNNLARVDLEARTSDRLAVFEPSSNPYLVALACDEGVAYVTQLIGGRVDVVDLRSGAVMELR